jgi:hypothetical protein
MSSSTRGHPSEPPDSLKYIEMDVLVSSGDAVCSHFTDKRNLDKLVSLYNISAAESTRNGRLNQEVGVSRERDLIASMASNPTLKVNYDLPNDAKEDVEVGERPVSIKHSSGKPMKCNGIKVVWTSNEDMQSKFVNTFKFHYDMIIVWINHKSNHIEIIRIPEKALESVRTLFQQANFPVLKSLTGNSRGIEFEPKFFDCVVNHVDMHIIYDFGVRDVQQDPIQRQLRLLESL